MPSAVSVSTPPQSAPKRQRTLANDDAHQQNAFFSALLDEDEGPSSSEPKIPSYLTKSQADISHLFHELEWKQRFRLSHAMSNRESPYRVDRSQIVIDRNRYGNVQPWDASRIKLKRPIGGSDYVNASPITLKSRKAAPEPASDAGTPPTSDVRSETKYIATQGPKDGQFSHFWHMVMQETVGDVGVIVMLTLLYEGNKEKCAQYFPKNMDNPVILLSTHEDGSENADGPPHPGDPFQDITLGRAGTDSSPTGTTPPQDTTPTEPLQPTPTPDSITLLNVTHHPSTSSEHRTLLLTLHGQTKVINHYLYTGWPDYGRPESSDRAALRNLVTESSRVAGSKTNPRFVHCSAGVGRTGTFIALDFLLSELNDGLLVAKVNEDAVLQNGFMHANSASAETETPAKEQDTPTPEPDDDDSENEDIIYATVDKLREQRMMMVMNELQFSFLYEVLREAWREKYSGAETVKEQQRAQTGIGVVTNTDQADRETGRGAGAGAGAGTGPVDGGGGGEVSEAETEIVDHDHEDNDDSDDNDDNDEGSAKDPYDAVAPQSIRQVQEGRL